jgi:hypothetical protein
MKRFFPPRANFHSLSVRDPLEARETYHVYLQSQQIADINWNRLQQVSDGAIITLSNAIMHIPGISGDSSHATATASSLAMTSFGIPLTGSMSAGFTIGFIKG